MALSAAETVIANQALGRIGANQYTAADGSQEEEQALVYFAQNRNFLLRRYKWPFAETRLRLVSSWLTDTVYTTDQYVWQSALLYKCAEAHTSDVFATDLADEEYWTLVSSVDAWETAKDYVLNSYVVNDAVYYRCILAHTSGDTDDEPGTGATYATYWVATTTKPTNVFGYSYDKPSGCLKLIECDDTNNYNWYGTYAYPLGNRSSDTWRFETNTILTTDTEIDIVYVDTITDTTKWDPLFIELFVATLAKKLVPALGGAGPGSASLIDDLNTEIKELSKAAQLIGGQEGNNSGSSDWNNARYY